jgi:hypothetical protein
LYRYGAGATDEFWRTMSLGIAAGARTGTSHK